MYESICPPRHVAVAVALDEEVNGFLLYCYNHDLLHFLTNYKSRHEERVFASDPHFYFVEDS